MRWMRLASAALVTSLAAWAGPAYSAPAPDRPPAAVPCDTCHDQPATWTKKPVVHAPVKGADCLACHNAHASRHGSLLKHGSRKTCLGCHQDLAERTAVETPHAALTLEKACLSCHDPHAADRPKLLLDEAAKLCETCHESVVKAGSATPHPHAPVAKGECLRCHDPHAAPRPWLAVKEEPALCASCHRTAEPKIVSAHKGVAFAEARCTSCHAPHGSESAGTIRTTVHPPFGEGSCDVCHSDPKAPASVLRAGAADLCLTCHEPRKAGHPVPKDGACVACHTPHASTGPALIDGRERLVCLACHSDIAARRAGGMSYHPVFGLSQDCTACHEVHTGQTTALLKKKDVQTTCMTCHASHSQFSHPMGEGVSDPSHPGRSLTCLSCHDPHGTPYPRFLLADPRQDLCIRCHSADMR